MHNFSELISRCTSFTLGALNEVSEKTISSLQEKASTPLVKTLQMVRLEKTIFVVGIISLFEAFLQNSLNCENGFKEAKSILKQKGDLSLLSRFSDIELAINALKHGKGRSYNQLLIKNGGTLTSEIKQNEESFFNEGDVSEISTLIDVDDKFIYSCVELIDDISKAIKEVRPEIIL